MVASKSTSDGDFARWFREILEDTVSEEKLDHLDRYLRDAEASLTFEVNDPVNDPHIIEYDNRHVVLLDVVRRATDFRKANYEVVKEVGEHFGLDVKQRGMKFDNKFQLLNWYRNVDGRMDKLHRGKPIEGYVFEAADGFMTKWKHPYYRFWKQMRSHHMRVAKQMETGQIPRDTTSGIRGLDWMTEQQGALAVEFNDWLWNGSGGQITDIGANIIASRKLFDKRHEPKPDVKAELSSPAMR